ncbi:MAG: hypothetical protein FWF73_06075 [Spirochaetes bacterium]|nr:hypothetical protein [Spirochaetota bacterium]
MNKYFKAFLIICFFLCIAASMYGKDKNYDKYGIIKGSKVHFRHTPYGITMKDLKDGELVYLIKKEKQITRKGEEDFWCQIVTNGEKIGWVRNDDIYCLDESLIPEKYYIQILEKRFGRNRLRYDQMYGVKFEYFKDNNIIIFRYAERESFFLIEVSEIYEIKDEKIIDRSPFFSSYESKFFVDEKFIFSIDFWMIEIFNRKKYNDKNEYVLQARAKIPNAIDPDKSIIDYNKSENCYFLKINVHSSYRLEPYGKSAEEIYKFDEKKLVRVK